MTDNISIIGGGIGGLVTVLCFDKLNISLKLYEKAEHLKVVGAGIWLSPNALQSQLIGFSNSTLRVEMKMFDTTKTVLKTVLWTTFSYFDIKNKTKAEHSTELNSLFKKILNHIENNSFEKRYRQIISDLKSE